MSQIKRLEDYRMLYVKPDNKIAYVATRGVQPEGKILQVTRAELLTLADELRGTFVYYWGTEVCRLSLN